MTRWAIPLTVILAPGVLLGQNAERADKATNKSRPSLGMSVIEGDRALYAAMKDQKIPSPSHRGLWVTEVSPGGPAKLAGIKPFDLLVIWTDGKLLLTPEQFADWTETLEFGRRYPVTLYRPPLDEQVPMIWKKATTSIGAMTRGEVEEAALRHGYFPVDGGWVRLPDFDFSKRSSCTETKGSLKHEFREYLPRIAVGEHGKIPSFRVIQVLGSGDAIVEVGYDEPKWLRLIGVNFGKTVDGQRAAFNEPIAIFGTWQYTTALGATNTIFLAAPVARIQGGLSDDELERLRAWLAMAP